MTASPEIALRVEDAFDCFGQEWNILFEAGPGLQTSREWLSASALAAIPAAARPHLVGVTAAGQPAALFPLLSVEHGELQSLTTPYTCLWQPLLRPNTAPDILHSVLRAVGRHCRKQFAVTRLEALDPEWPHLERLQRAFRQAGLACRRYDHFVNWYDDVQEGWNGYLDARPGALRETIRRKGKAVARDPTIRVDRARTPAEVAHALSAYEAVYARSWKEPEPFPDFNAVASTRLAATDRLRMFVMWSQDRPVAAQYWTISCGSATVLKLAHDEQEKRLSPGTVLTAAAIRSLIEEDGIVELDFGRGDDPYKRSWTGKRRQRIGLIALDPLTGHGLRTVLRHDLGRALKRWKGSIRARAAKSAN